MHVRRIAVLCVLASVLTVSEARADEASLRGSAAGMQRQNRVAKDQGYDFYRSKEDIERAVERGELVEVPGNDDYEVAPFVGHRYARPEVRLFVERLAAQYRKACGQKLVVTSLTRPATQQPANAHALSVHPAGMAVDLRVSDRASCREWLEQTLLELERRGVLDGIREYNPPHYHVAVFPEAYREYVEELLAREREDRETEEAAPAAADVVASSPIAAALSVVTSGDEDVAPVAAAGGDWGPFDRLLAGAGAALLLLVPAAVLTRADLVGRRGVDWLKRWRRARFGSGRD